MVSGEELTSQCKRDALDLPDPEIPGLPLRVHSSLFPSQERWLQPSQPALLGAQNAFWKESTG